MGGERSRAETMPPALIKSCAHLSFVRGQRVIIAVIQGIETNTAAAEVAMKALLRLLCERKAKLNLLLKASASRCM
jgi:hypothetical protein